MVGLRTWTSGSPIHTGFEAFAFPILDTYKFRHALAKIARCFAADVLGDEFSPILPDVI
jgi:hypothetical protein